MTAPRSLPNRRGIDSISIGQRHRRDLGDVDVLAATIADVGLLHPVVIRPDGTLVAGERRIAACKLLGWDEIPVTVIDIDAIARGELAENAHRKDFTPSEMVAIAATVERRERELARQRQAHDGPRSGKLPERSRGDTRDKVAAPLGVSGKTLERAQAVVAAAKANPESFGKLLDDMDRTGRVNGVYRRLKNIKQAEAIRAEPPLLPGNGPYRVIVADPAWPYELARNDPSTRGVHPYPTMHIDEVCALQVATLAGDDCVLWLWLPSMLLANGTGARVVEAWRFSPRTILTWAKNKMGNGTWLRGQTEHCIMAVRGKPTVTLTNQTTLFHAPVRAHSQKPLEFYDFVEKLCPAPRYCDLFSRYRHNEKWDCHGDQAPATNSTPFMQRGAS